MEDICLLDIATPPSDEKRLVYRFDRIQKIYKPSNHRLGKLMFIAPRQLAHAMLDDFRRLAKNPTPLNITVNVN